MLDLKIEKNILTAPGRPGSVDKGEREKHGVRLAISTKSKVKNEVCREIDRAEKLGRYF